MKDVPRETSKSPLGNREPGEAIVTLCGDVGFSDALKNLFLDMESEPLGFIERLEMNDSGVHAVIRAAEGKEEELRQLLQGSGFLDQGLGFFREEPSMTITRAQVEAALATWVLEFQASGDSVAQIVHFSMIDAKEWASRAAPYFWAKLTGAK